MKNDNTDKEGKQKKKTKQKKDENISSISNTRLRGAARLKSTPQRP